MTVAKNNTARRDLPKGWRWVRIGDVCVRRTGVRDPGSAPDNSFCYVDIGSVDNKAKRIIEAKELLGNEAPSRARQVIRAFDVIVATTRPNLNAVALVPLELDDEICSTGLCVLRPLKDELEPQFLFAYVQSEEFVNSLSDLVKGALYPAVTDSQVRDQLIPLPPLPEQRRIAALLGEQMAAVERARAAAEARLGAARALPAAYLREVFEGEEARGWSKKKLGDISTLLPAHSIATQGKATVQAITTACLTEAGFDPAGIKTARMRADDAEEALVRPGEVLIARSNTPQLVGRVALYTGTPPGIVASDLTIRIWPSSDIDGRFITYYLSSLFLSGYWQEYAGGASGSMKKITRSQLVDIAVPYPALPRQQEIAGLLEEKLFAARQSAEILRSELKAIESLPAALLRQAFSGEL